MHINLLTIPFVIVLGLFLGINDNKRSRKMYIIICCAVLVFVAAMRSPEWMTYEYHIDSMNYKDYFEEERDMTWGDAWHSILMRYSGSDSESDMGLVILEKTIGSFTHDFSIYSLIVDLLFFLPFGIILFRYTSNIKQIIFAFVFYISLIQIHLFSGARQIIALGFDLMALLAVFDAKRLWAIVFFLLGLSIHFSSFLFLAPLLMIWYDMNPRVLKILHVACLFLAPVVFMIPNQIIVFMGNASGLEKYAAYGEGTIQGGATMFIILIELLSLFCLVAIRSEDLKRSKVVKDFYVMAPLLTVFAPLIRSNGTMTRISLYYYLFLALLVPYAIDRAFKANNKLAYFGAIGALAFLVISGGGIVYYFYWQY